MPRKYTLDDAIHDASLVRAALASHCACRCRCEIYADNVLCPDCRDHKRSKDLHTFLLNYSAGIQAELEHPGDVDSVLVPHDYKDPNGRAA